VVNKKRRRTAHKTRSCEAISHRDPYTPYEWWHPIEMLELDNDVTHARAMAFKGAAITACKPGPGIR
jgi:hypothetical protein